MRSEVLLVVLMTVVIFCDITLHRLTPVVQRVGLLHQMVATVVVTSLKAL